MSDAMTTEAARALSAKRWGSTRPSRMARELVGRVHELSPSEKALLRNALAMADIRKD